MTVPNNCSGTTRWTVPSVAMPPQQQSPATSAGRHPAIIASREHGPPQSPADGRNRQRANADRLQLMTADQIRAELPERSPLPTHSAGQDGPPTADRGGDRPVDRTKRTGELAQGEEPAGRDPLDRGRQQDRRNAGEATSTTVCTLPHRAGRRWATFGTSVGSPMPSGPGRLPRQAVPRSGQPPSPGRLAMRAASGWRSRTAMMRSSRAMNLSRPRSASVAISRIRSAAVDSPGTLVRCSRAPASAASGRFRTTVLR